MSAYWKDISSYSQSDKKRKVKTVAIREKYLNLLVTRYIHSAPDVWMMECEPFIGRMELQSKELEDAKREALAALVNRLDEAYTFFSDLIEAE